MPKAETRQEGSELVETASAVGGALAGTAVTLVAGPFVGSAAGEAIARVLLRVGAEIERRLLGPRQEARIAEAYEVAAAEIASQLEDGAVLRADFVEAPPEESPAWDLLEGTLRTAADAWEQRKVPFIGRIFGRLSFDASVSPSEASYLLKLADRLTYRQLVLLGFWEAVQDPEGRHARVIRDYAIQRAERGGSASRSVTAEMDDLASAGLIGVASQDEQVVPPSALWHSTGGFAFTPLDEVRVTTLGATLYRLMGLEGLPEADLDEIWSAIRG